MKFQLRNGCSKSFKMLFGLWMNQGLLQFLQGFYRKCAFAKMQDESESVFSVWWLSKLGFICAETRLYIICLRSANDVLSWFSVNALICTFAKWKNVELEVQSCTRVGLH